MIHQTYHSPNFFADSRIIRRLIPFSFFILGFCGYALQAIDYFAAVPGDMGDARFNSVILEHVYRWVVGQEPSLFSPPFFYPFENILYFSDNHFGSVMFYIPLRLLGFEREIAFDIWFLLSFCLNFLSAYICFKLLNFSDTASSVGAFIFTFSLPVLHNELHAQLFYRFQTPMAFAYFWNYLQKRNASHLASAIFWVVWQFFSSIYLGVFLFYFLSAVLVAWMLWGTPKNILKDTLHSITSYHRGKTLLCTVLLSVFVFSLGWMFYNYMAVRNEYHLRFPEWQLLLFLPHIGGYIQPGNRQFFGYAVYIFFLIGIFASFTDNTQKNLGKISFIGLLIIIILTANVHGKSLYAFFQLIPGVKAIRVVGRIVLVMTLPVGILAAMAVEKITLQLSCPRKMDIYTHMILFLTALFLLGIEVIAYTPGHTSIDVWRTRKKDIQALLPKDISSDSILMVTEKNREGNFITELDGMIIAQDLNIATLNGYSGFVTPGYQPPKPCIPPVKRLLIYAEFRNKNAAEIQKLEKNIVVVSATPCNPEPATDILDTNSTE